MLVLLIKPVSQANRTNLPTLFNRTHLTQIFPQPPLRSQFKTRSRVLSYHVHFQRTKVSKQKLWRLRTGDDNTGSFRSLNLESNQERCPATSIFNARMLQNTTFGGSGAAIEKRECFRSLGLESNQGAVFKVLSYHVYFQRMKLLKTELFNIAGKNL